MAGYSGTPLPKKLGLAPRQRLAFVSAPEAFTAALGALPDGAANRLADRPAAARRRPRR
jgi:hypothetical protein